MSDVPVWVPIISALAGGALVGTINFAMRWQDRKAQDKRHLRELMFKSAVEEWKQHCMLALEIMKTGKKTAIEPLLTYLVHQIKLSEVLLEGEITKENMSAKLIEVADFMKEVKKFTAPPRKENEQNNV